MTHFRAVLLAVLSCQMLLAQPDCQYLAQGCDPAQSWACGTYGSMRGVVSGSYASVGTDVACNVDTGHCECNIDGYEATTCLPDVNGCTMCQATGLSQFDPSYPGYIPYDSGGYSMYYCFNQIFDYANFGNEIRAVGVYEASSVHTTSAPISVNLRTCTDSPDLSKPVILLLSSYEAVDWSISSNDQYVLDNLDLDRIEVVAYKYATSSVTLQDELNATTEIAIKYPYDEWNSGYGYGSDSGGGSTAKMLYNAYSVLGDFVYSFIGEYRATQIEVCVGDQNVEMLNATAYDGVISPTNSPTSAPSSATDAPTPAQTEVPSSDTTSPSESPTPGPTTSSPTAVTESPTAVTPAPTEADSVDPPEPSAGTIICPRSVALILSTIFYVCM